MPKKKGVVISAGAEGDLTARNWFLNKYFPGDDLNLSKRITALRWQGQVAEAIRVNLQGGTNLVSLANKLSTYTTEQDINSTVRELERQARRIIGGDASEYAQFQRLVRSTRDEALGMIEANQPSRLGKAYARVADAAESLSEKALDAAIENAVDKKALSNAFRLATTEINKAVNLGEYTRTLADEDAEAMQLILSPAGNNCDDCIELAETDNGAGPGVWPLDQVPATPVHPHCRCLLLPVYRLSEGADPDFTVDPEDYEGDFMKPIPQDVLDLEEE